MRRLSSELHELILQQCNLHTLKRIRLAAGKGYWQELSVKRSLTSRNWACVAASLIVALFPACV